MELRCRYGNWALIAVSLSLTSCAVEEPALPTSGEGVTGVTSSRAAFVVQGQELVTTQGKRYLRMTDDLVKRWRSDPGLEGDYSDQHPAVQAFLERVRAHQLATRPVDQLSDEELADALRPVLHVDEGVFLAADGDVPVVKAMRALKGKSVKLAESYSPSGNYDIYFGKHHGQPTHGCCGTDDRWAVGANTAWPYATVIASFNVCNIFSSNWGNDLWCQNGSNVYSRDCTWQLIGHSTAIAAAHCFYDTAANKYLPCFEDGYGPFCRYRWGAAPDASDNAMQPIPPGYPTLWAGYSMQVPFLWYQATDPYLAIQYDYAVIDFTGYAIPNPGYTAGWVGWGVLNNSDTLNSMYQIWGVPKTDFYDTPYSTWPRIRGSTAIRYPSSVSTYVTYTPGDVSAGNSGTGLIQYVNVWGGWYVTGTITSYENNTCCARARRLESTYLSFIQSASTEY